MAGKRFNPDKLAQHLEPYGFSLNLPEVMKGGISFVRRSSVKRLYEHVLIRTGKPTYAEAVISGASFTSCHPCVSERDHRFRAFLSGDADVETSLLLKSARTFQQRLVENADQYCKSMAADKGPVLVQRILPVFKAVNSYAKALGDIFAILDREFAFVSEGSPDEQAQVDRLATFACRWWYLNSEDAKLASIALVRFGSQVEGSPSPFQNINRHRDSDLAARLILLTDYVRAKRLEYES
jgi:hypothetical protein